MTVHLGGRKKKKSRTSRKEDRFILFCNYGFYNIKMKLKEKTNSVLTSENSEAIAHARHVY